ncbi:MAG: hypothetical protein FWD74_11540, partial [Actinomycetia bacterium]|nr:hypothetical protein [Actinomycetes bacterium]
MKKRSRLRGSTALATAAVLSITGVFWASPTASAGVVLAPTPGHGPSISVVNPDLTPARDSDGSAKTTLQVGTLLLADPGRWNDMSGTKFSYQWAVVDAATGAATDAAASTGKSKNYVPVVSNIGAKIRVTVTATNKTKGDGAGTASVTTATVVVGLNPTLKTAPPAASTKTPYQQVFGKTRPYTTEAFLTMYGYPDNTPPSADIA